MSGLSCGTRAFWLWSAGSVVAAHGLSCPTACGILVPRPGIKPMSPTLEGGFSTTGPPRKSPLVLFNLSVEQWLTVVLSLGSEKWPRDCYGTGAREIRAVGKSPVSWVALEILGHRQIHWQPNSLSSDWNLYYKLLELNLHFYSNSGTDWLLDLEHIY